MKRTHLLLVGGPAALLGSGCGPTEIEAGALALLAVLPALLVGAALQRLYLAARRRISEAHRGETLDWRPTLLLGALSLGLWIVALLRLPQASVEDVPLAVAFVGTSYMSFLAIALRLSAGGPSFSWATLLPWAYAAIPGFLLAILGSHQEASDVILLYFLMPGYVGIVAGPLVLLLFAEVGIRVLWRKRREAAAAPAVPEARVVDE